jgi:hypothetical protein
MSAAEVVLTLLQGRARNCDQRALEHPAWIDHSSVAVVGLIIQTFSDAAQGGLVDPAVGACRPLGPSRDDLDVGGVGRLVPGAANRVLKLAAAVSS